MPPTRFAGVMSGTSLDGADAVIASFDNGCRLEGFAHVDFPARLRDELFRLQSSGPDEIARAATAANALADVYADAILAACASASIAPSDVAAAGVHGQTVRHRPDLGYTVQLNHPSRVVERCGITVVADFRSRDVAAGGQGAPLVPAFHHALFAKAGRARGVVNIGGIANVTELAADGSVRGFDTGPGNVLLDAWHARHHGGPFDVDGAWAASGRVDERLLAVLLDDGYFRSPPPKSTGRDRFHPAWLQERLTRAGGASLAAADVQATLTALTVETIAGAIERWAPATQDVLVCGGGANNAALMNGLAQRLAPRAVRTTASEGVAVGHVEALAFAWLARETLAGRPGSLAAVTGASGPRVLGAVYPR